MSSLEATIWKVFDGGSPQLRTSIEALVVDIKNMHGLTGEQFVKSLLERFSYVSRDAYDDAINGLAELLHSNFDMTRTLLCATTADHQKDSAQTVLNELTTALGFFGYTNIKSANRYDRAQKFIGDIDDIILVDEFVGTGQSIIGRVRAMTTQFQQKTNNVPRIHAYVVAAMDFGLKAINANVTSSHARLILKPGLRGFLDGSLLAEAYVALDAIETCLYSEVSGVQLPKHGFGGCEALYARKMGNCPNSVLPMFWWPKDSHGNKRTAPFTRVF